MVGRLVRTRQNEAWEEHNLGTGIWAFFLGYGARLRGRTATQRSKKGSETGQGSGEGFWGRVLRRGSAMGFTVKRVLRGVLRRGSEKGLSRRCLERPLVEYAPLGVSPIGSNEEIHTAKIWPRLTQRTPTY